MRIADHQPEEVTIDGETFLQWRIPGPNGTIFVTMAITLERFNSNPWDKLDAQTALDKLISHD